jgi:hypothetical protein
MKVAAPLAMCCLLSGESVLLPTMVEVAQRALHHLQIVFDIENEDAVVPIH